MVRNLKNIKNPLFVIPVEVRIRLSILNKYVTASLSQNLNFRKLGIFSWIIVDETWKEPCDDSVFANGDVTYLICHLNSQDRMMERLYDSWVGVPIYATTMISLVTKAIVIVKTE